MNHRFISVTLLLFSFHIQACRPDSDSKPDPVTNSMQGQIYRGEHLFDLDSEESACNKAHEIAGWFSVNVEGCSLKDRTLLEISAKNGEAEETKIIKVDNFRGLQQEYLSLSEVEDTKLALFFREMVTAATYTFTMDPKIGS